MFCFATQCGRDDNGNDLYDALVWDTEEMSVNDDGAKATAREQVAVPRDADDIAAVIRAAMSLSDVDDVELN